MNKKRNNAKKINKKLKRRKPNNVDSNEIVAAVDVQNEETSQPDIFKLNAICCDDLFEWLSLEDLDSLGQTCKRMHRLTGLYFQENFKNAKIQCRDQHIYHDNSELSGLVPYIQSVQFDLSKWKDFQYFRTINCESLRGISIRDVKLTKAMINCIKGKLDKIETIDYYTMKSSKVKFYEDFLKFCPNLKTLCIRYSRDMESDWLRQEYSKLEHLTLRHGNFGRDIEIFLQKNSHLKSLEINRYFLLKNRDAFINSKIELDVLNIVIHGGDRMDDIRNLLNELHGNGFYKKLECSLFFAGGDDPTKFNRISEFPSLEKVVYWSNAGFVLPTILTNLKELRISTFNSYNTDFEAITASFPNLRQITLSWVSTIDGILIFIRRLPQLKELSINFFDAPSVVKLDLPTLHEERKRLAGACKVTIYLPEYVYLATKEAPKNIYINHDLIEIKRIEQDNRILLISLDY